VADPDIASWRSLLHVDGSTMIGRRVGPTIVPEPNFSQRVDGDVVVLMKPGTSRRERASSSQ
jgi:hypothetical protein